MGKNKVVENKKVEGNSNGCPESNHLQEGREAERTEDERACQSRGKSQLPHIR